MVDFDLNDPDAVEHALRHRSWRERHVLTDAEAVGMSAASADEFIPIGLLTSDATVGVLRILQEYKVIKALNARIKPRGWRRLWTLEHVVRAHVVIAVSDGFAISKATAATVIRVVYNNPRRDEPYELPSLAFKIVDRTCDAIKRGVPLQLDQPEVIYLANRRQLYLKTWVQGREVLLRVGTAVSLASTNPIIEREPFSIDEPPQVSQDELEQAVSLTSVKLHQALHALTVRAMEVGK